MRPDGDDQRRRRERLLLGDESRYTQSEVADKAGVTLDQAMALWRALGFPAPDPGERAFTDGDVDALRSFATLLSSTGFDESFQLAMARSTGQAMARLADSQMGNFTRLLQERIGDSEDDEAAAIALGIAEPLLPSLALIQRYVWRRHLFAASEHVFARLAQPVDTAPLVVGFADISGFTALSRGLSQGRLEEFIENFESATSSVISGHGARVIKTLGDEVMFTAGSPGAAAEIGLALAEWTSELDGRPTLHVGMAFGPVLHRLGDVYGNVVNIASRLTSVARTGTVLVDRELASAVTDDPGYHVKRLRSVRVRGFSHLQPWLLERQGAGGGGFC